MNETLARLKEAGEHARKLSDDDGLVMTIEASEIGFIVKGRRHLLGKVYTAQHLLTYELFHAGFINLLLDVTDRVHEALIKER